MTVHSDIVYKSKILIVDDVEANLRVLCRRLEGEDYDLHAVDSGEKALQYIEENKPDLVLLDYMMPHMNGIDVLNIVRGEWKMDALPIIMLTARAEAEAVVSALEAGADDYISKPIDFDVLKARIENQLVKVRANDGLRQANAALDERVAMRLLAFDQIRVELEREITMRKRAERILEEFQMAPKADALPQNYASELEMAITMVDRISMAASSGKAVNQALLSSLRAKLIGLMPQASDKAA